jgi:hypothetical protein
LFAEANNPAMLAIASQMQVIATKSFDHGGYEYNNYFEHTLHAYRYSGAHEAHAKTIRVLSAGVNGTVDDAGDPVTTDHLFRQRPLEHLPHPDIRWFVVDSADGRITRYPMYEWFAYLSEEAIVQNQLWLSILYRRALRMDSSSSSSSSCNGGNYRSTVSLNDNRHPLRNVWARSWATTGI